MFLLLVLPPQFREISTTIWLKKMKEAYLAQELAQILGVSIRQSRRQAAKEGWPYLEEPNPKGGGFQKVFPFGALPDYVKYKIVDAYEARVAREAAEKQAAAADMLRDPGPGCDCGAQDSGNGVCGAWNANCAPQEIVDLAGPVRWMNLDEKERRIAQARMVVLEAADRYTEDKVPDRKKIQALRVFYRDLAAALKAKPKDSAALVRLGFPVEKIPLVIEHVHKSNPSTDYRWRTAYAAAQEKYRFGLLGLVRTKRKTEGGFGARCLTKDVVAYARMLMLKGAVQLYPMTRSKGEGRLIRTNGALLYRRVQGFFKETKLPSLAHWSRWLNHYLTREQESLCAAVLPSFWRAAFAPSGGEASADVTFAGEHWEIDGTKADVMLKDGRHEILVAIDVFSRDVVWQVNKNASAITTAKLFFDGFVRWGIPEKITPDRGTIFLADHITTACDALDIDLCPCLAYSPNNKPHVERFFGTMSKMLFEAMNWYIGHNQNERKRIEEYGKFEQVFYHRRGEKISCDATAQELRQVITDWVEKVYRVEPHKWVDCKYGRADTVLGRLAQSEQRAPKASDLQAIEWMLSPAIERVWNSGVQWLGPDKYMPVDIASWEIVQKYQKQKVIFRPLLSDVGRGTVWEAGANGVAGKLICYVLAEERGGLSLEDYKKAKKNIEKKHKDRRKALESLKVQSYEAELAEMPQPKVAVANFGAVEFENRSYKELKGFKPTLMPTKPEAGWVSPKEEADLAEELAWKSAAGEPKEERTEEHPTSNVQPQQEEYGEIRWEEVREMDEAARYEQVIRGEARGLLIPKDLREDAWAFEKTPIFARLKDYFEERRSMYVAMPWL